MTTSTMIYLAINLIGGFLIGYSVRGLIKYKPAYDLVVSGKKLLEILGYHGQIFHRVAVAMVEEKAQSDQAVKRIEAILEEYKTKF